jgi:hypothetical protein
MSRIPWLGALVVQLLLSQGCRSCSERVHGYTLDDAQIARVTEGTAAPTAHGCEVVCWEVSSGRDAGTVDGGLPATAPIRVESCTLSGQHLTCDFGLVCQV